MCSACEPVGWALRQARPHGFCMTDRRNAHAVRSIDSVGKIAGRTGQTSFTAACDFAHPTVTKLKREDVVRIRKNFSRAALLVGSMLAAACPAFAADVTPARLLNPDKEPQNWLMNHRTYDGQRFSTLARIDRGNVKNLKLAFAVPLGGTAGNESNEATALAEDGFLYITDSWGVLYKIDGTSGDVGRV